MEKREITAKHIYAVESWAEEWIMDSIFDISIFLSRGEGLRLLKNLIHSKYPEVHAKFKRECLDVEDSYYDKDRYDITSWLNEANNWNIDKTDLSSDGDIGNDIYGAVMADVYSMCEFTRNRFWKSWDDINKDAEYGYQKLEIVES
jgi:hypothetical protein